MEEGFMSVFFGAVIGAVISSLTIAAVVFWKNKSANKSQVQKESIMYSIGELCAEIDSLIASNKEGLVNNSGIQGALRKKHDEIIRLLKPNMHILDVYFVKYIDCVQKDYLKLLTGTHVDTIQSPASSKSIAFSIENKAEHNIGSESFFEKNSSSSSRSGSIEHDLQALESAFFKESGEPAITKPLNPIVSKPDDEAKKEKMAESTNEASIEKEIVFEAVTEPKAVLDKNVKENASPDKAIDEEEFSMETIMDLDVGKLTRAAGLGDNTPDQRSAKKHELFNAVSKETKDQSSNTLNPFLSTKKTESPSVLSSDNLKGTPQFSSKSKPETVISHSEPLAALVKDSPVIANDSSGAEHIEKKDIEITGDDVADKIDAFFGFSSKS